MNLFYVTAVSSFHWYYIVGIIVVLLICICIPWKKIFSKEEREYEKKEKLQKKELLKLNRQNTLDDFAKQKPRIEAKKKLYLGIFNGFGHKQAIRMKRLVYVYPEKDSCDLCRPFEGTVISLEKYDNKYVCMSEAISKGYHHIGCKHEDFDYYPGETKIPKPPYNEQDQQNRHNLVLELLKKQNDVRNLVYELDNGININYDEQSKKIEELKLQIKSFCKDNNLMYDENKLVPYITEPEKFSYNDEVIKISRDDEGEK